MKNFKFTGVNIAAALLVIAFFFPWVSAMGEMSMSGFSITTTGISPGMLSMFLKGTDRLLMILMAVIPISAGIILYQNVSGNNKLDKYYKPAHIAPAILLIMGLAIVYFKIKPDAPDAYEGLGHSLRSLSHSMQPGLFDILGLGMYASIAASVYIALVRSGKIKDKEYYKPAIANAAHAQTNTQSNEPQENLNASEKI